MFSNHPLSLSRNIIIALIVAFIAVIALVATARYFIVRKRAEQKQPSQSIPVSGEVSRLLMPPADAQPVEINKEVLDSITPPTDTKLTVIDQNILNSITPPARR